MSEYTRADLDRRLHNLCRMLGRSVGVAGSAGRGQWYIDETPAGLCVCEVGPVVRYPLGYNHYSVYHMCRALEMALVVARLAIRLQR